MSDIVGREENGWVYENYSPREIHWAQRAAAFISPHEKDVRLKMRGYFESKADSYADCRMARQDAEKRAFEDLTRQFGK